MSTSAGGVVVLAPHSLGPLPLTREPIRFCAGAPDGMTSESWRVWTGPRGDVYVSCRELRSTKVSLHISGVWRFAFVSAERARGSQPVLLDDRCMDRWAPPPPVAPGVVPAYQIAMPTSEFRLGPADRKAWPDLVYVLPPPVSDLMSVASVYLTETPAPIQLPGQATLAPLAVLPLPDGRHVQVVAEWLPLQPLVDALRVSGAPDGPPDLYRICHGITPAGVRWIVGYHLRLAQGH